MKPCPDGPCDACTLRDCETHVAYVPLPGKPLTPDCSPDGLIFIPSGKGGGKLYKPLKVNGKVKTISGRAIKSSLVARVTPYQGKA